MIIYRHHRGSLSDAMAEARVFANEDEMKRWIVDDSTKAFGKPLFSVDDIVIGAEAILDSRNGWKDTRYVCVKRYGSEVYPVPQCIGMCATKWDSGSDYISRADAREYVRHAYAKGLNLVGYVDEVPAADVVTRDAFNRILAENDVMRAQLAQIGKKPGDSMDDIMLGVYIVKKAMNNYGVDVTKLRETATAQKAALDAAYMRGKNDAYKQTTAKDDPYKPLWPNWED